MGFMGPEAWLFAILGGAILLGIAIAYGMKRSSKLTRGEVAQQEAATKREYQVEEADRKRQNST